MQRSPERWRRRQRKERRPRAKLSPFDGPVPAGGRCGGVRFGGYRGDHDAGGRGHAECRGDPVDNAKTDCTAATHRQKQGDTYYITLPAKYLPIMQPAVDFAQATGTSALVIPVVNLISPTVQTLIETG